MKLNADTIRAAAQHRWHGILTALGIPAESLTDKHQPCPICGGRDRFRYDDKDGRGTFICSHYNNGGGDGFHLVQHAFDCDFAAALNRVAGVLGLTDTSRPEKAAIAIKAENKPVERVQDKQAKLLSLFNQSQPMSVIDPIAAYLRGRGLNTDGDLPQMLRYAELPYWVQLSDGTYKPLGSHPVMLAAICNLDGELQGLHQTYLKPAWIKPHGENGNHTPTFTKLNINHPETGQPLPAKKMQSRYTGALSGAAVQLYPMDGQGRLCVAEGIETALAAHELFGLPVWACLSANGIKSLALPDGLRELLIVADHDSPRPIGYEAAHSLAVRAIKQGIRVQLWQPEEENTDALDELNRRKRPAWKISQQVKAV
ncbi:MAG: toprim domain-containing protein [Neisseria sp.]|nr:toprim domain-containing protein [Neisseria sp.]